MKKQTAIQLLGGSIAEAAKAVGVTYWAVYKWPETLSPRVSDRVEAALARIKAQRTTKNKSVVAHCKVIV